MAVNLQPEEQDVTEPFSRLSVKVPFEDKTLEAVAYHVTNIPASDMKLEYPRLTLNVADDETYDGILVGLPVVCFTTTCYCDFRNENKVTLPSKSPYPRPCGPNLRSEELEGKRHKRVSVPLKKFQGYDWWKMNSIDGQIHLLFTRDDWSTMLRNSIGVQFKAIDDKQNNDYLLFHENSEEWQRNLYKIKGKEICYPFVNIFFVDEVQLDEGCTWDAVPHSGANTGSRREFQQKDNQHHREKWILEKVMGVNIIGDGSDEAKKLKSAARQWETAAFQASNGKTASKELLKSVHRILYA